MNLFFMEQYLGGRICVAIRMRIHFKKTMMANLLVVLGLC